jgi:hypothetical protein
MVRLLPTAATPLNGRQIFRLSTLDLIAIAACLTGVAAVNQPCTGRVDLSDGLTSTNSFAALRHPAARRHRRPSGRAPTA